MELIGRRAARAAAVAPRSMDIHIEEIVLDGMNVSRGAAYVVGDALGDGLQGLPWTDLRAEASAGASLDRVDAGSIRAEGSAGDLGTQLAQNIHGVLRQ